MQLPTLINSRRTTKMPNNKMANIFQNLFTKSKSNKKNDKLKTDAAPISPTSSHIVRTSTNNTIQSMIPPSSIISENNGQLLSNTTNPLDSLTTTTNNQQTNQMLSVYQFSNVNGLHIGAVYNVNNTINTTTESIDRRPKHGVPIRKTKSIDAMMKSTDELTHRTMDIISSELGEGWRDVIRNLGFSDGRIEQMHEENHIKGIKEVIYQFLLEFMRNDDNANLGYLCRLLWKCGHKETVYILKEYWKNGELQSKDDDDKASEI